MSSAALKTASVLAFERKLNPSDALLYAVRWEEREQAARWWPIGIEDKAVRGTISSRRETKGQDPAKLDAPIDQPNPQTVDVAALPADQDTLLAHFSLRVLGGCGQPSACNDAGYRQRLHEVVQTYIDTHGFNELARRYAYNLANGRFLWRNRIGAEQVEVRIALLQNGQAERSWRFDALALSLRHFEASGETAAELEALTAVIAAGLAGERHVLLDITAAARLGSGQEVFPSQELILDRGRGEKSKTLYQVEKIAGIHSQKLGNAIRSIDTWYPEAEALGPIAVEPYGSVTSQGRAYRPPKEKIDFYTLLDDWMLKNQAPSTDNQHYVIAVLIRGGVFGKKAG